MKYFGRFIFFYFAPYISHLSIFNIFPTMTAKGIINMYVEGFRSMTIGRTLWAIILLKLFIMFFVLKLFFFPNILEKNYNTDAERASAVRHNLTDFE